MRLPVRRPLSVVLVAAVVLLAGLSIPAMPATAKSRPGGSFAATGFFHTTRVGDRRWLVDPQGRPFYSNGIDHVSSAPDTDRSTGVCPYCQAVAAGYSSTDAWADAQVARLRSWGFNTLARVLRRLQSPSQPDALHGAAVDGQRRRLVRARLRQPRRRGCRVRSSPSATTPTCWATSPTASCTGVPTGAGPCPFSTTTWPCRRDRRDGPSPPRTWATRAGSCSPLAQRYFSVTTAAIRRYDPNHLILGVKAVAQLIEPELLRAAGPYVDVWSVDDYQLLPAVQQAIETGVAGLPPRRARLRPVRDDRAQADPGGRVRVPGRRQWPAQHLAAVVFRPSPPRSTGSGPTPPMSPACTTHLGSWVTTGSSTPTSPPAGASTGRTATGACCRPPTSPMVRRSLARMTKAHADAPRRALTPTSAAPPTGGQFRPGRVRPGGRRGRTGRPRRPPRTTADPARARSDGRGAS